MKNRNVYLMAGAAALGWGLLLMILFSPPEWLTPKGEPPVRHPVYEPATIEGPPVIILRHLLSQGFDAEAVERIESHFHVLNAALVTIVELEREYLAAPAAARGRILSQAVYFHTTADVHEEQIEQNLPESLRIRFHDYIREREAAVGLHQDTIWHNHGMPSHAGVSPGFETSSGH